MTLVHWQAASWLGTPDTGHQVEGDQPRAWKAGYRGWLQVAEGVLFGDE